MMSKDHTQFSQQEIQRTIEQLDNWQLLEGKLYKEFIFANFEEAFSFVVQVALVAQKLNHHPDLFNSYNQVKLTLWTHSANAVTNKDVELAQAIDKLS